MNKHEKYTEKLFILLDELADNVNIAPVDMQYKDAKSAIKRLHNALNVDEFVKENHDGDNPRTAERH